MNQSFGLAAVLAGVLQYGKRYAWYATWAVLLGIWVAAVWADPFAPAIPPQPRDGLESVGWYMEASFAQFALIASFPALAGFASLVVSIRLMFAEFADQ